MKLMKRLVCILLAAMILSLPVFAEDAVRIIVNNEILNFPDAAPYYDTGAGRIYVPIRPLTEKLGANVGYNGESQEVTIETNSLSLLLKIGSNKAFVNGVETKLDAPAFVKDGFTYVPLRFVSENLLLDVSYDDATKTATLSNRAFLELDMSEDEAKLLYGEPDRVDVTEKGYQFHVYNKDLSNYTLIGIDNQTVVAYYIESLNWMLPNGLRVGMTQSSAESLFPSKEYGRTKTDGYEIFSGKEITTTVFFDENGLVRSVLTEKTEYTNKSKINADVLEGFEAELVDLINVQRVRKGLDPFKAENDISDVAKKHAADMAKNSLFSHTGSDKSTPTERLTKAGFKNFYQLEIIAEAYPNTLYAFSGHVILDDYHEVLSASYKKIGVGVAYNAKSDGVLYYNHIFYADKK